MTVKELVEILQTYPQDLQVVYRCYSEQVLLEVKDLQVKAFCKPRPDGWVQNQRPDMPSIDYLCFPGN